MEKETNTDTAKQTIVDAEEIKTETVEEGGKYDIIWLIAEPALFAYNTYVIVNNITLGGGYLWVALGIVINIGVALSYKSVFSNAVKKFNPNWAYAVLAVMLFIGIQGGYNDVEEILEESAVPIVNEILEDELGKGNASKCIEVRIGEEFSDNFYKARAIFANGKDIEIVIENVNDKQVRVSMDLNQ